MLTHVELSKKGGEAVLKRFGPDHFREIGKRGGRASGQSRRGVTTVTRTVRLSPQTAESLDGFAAHLGMTTSGLMVKAVAFFLEHQPKAAGR